MVAFRTLRTALACVFVAMVVISVFSIFSATSLLAASYAVVNQIDVSWITLSLDNSDQANPKINVTLMIDNPTSTNVSLSYTSITGYIFESILDRNLFQNVLFKKTAGVVHNPRLHLGGSSNLTISVLMDDVDDVLHAGSPKYWFVTIVLQFPDAPLLGNRALLYRYAYVETDF